MHAHEIAGRGQNKWPEWYEPCSVIVPVAGYSVASLSHEIEQADAFIWYATLGEI